MKLFGLRANLMLLNMLKIKKGKNIIKILKFSGLFLKGLIYKKNDSMF